MKLKCFGLLAAMLMLSSPASAALVISVDMDTTTAGIQTSRIASVGEQVQIGLVMELTGASSLSSYSTTFRWDTTEVDFVSRQFFIPPGMVDASNAGSSSDNAGGNDPVFGAAYGETTQIAAFTLGNGPAAPFGPFNFATFTFNATAPQNGDTGIDFYSFFIPGFDGAFDNGGNDISGDVVFNSGQMLTAVPEPSSVAALTVMGVAGLTRVVRNRRKAAKA